MGIRPTIDGRRQGVRESLEQQTMGMAQSVAQLISSSLHYPDGTPVQCVIADTCIGGVAEAALCEQKFQRTGVGLSITVTPCWCYGTETIDMDPFRPKASGALMAPNDQVQSTWPPLAGHNQKGLPPCSIWPYVQDADDPQILAMSLISFCSSPRLD